MEERDLPDVVEEFLEQLESDGRSERHVEDARARLHKLAASFRGPIDEISKSDLQSWVNSRKVAGRTKNNFRALLVSLFRYARDHGFLPAQLPTHAENLSKANEVSGDIGILSVAEMKKFLGGASEGLVPLLAIGGFAGLRAAEIFRIDWEEVDFKQSHIEIKSGKAKTAQRRLAPLPANLKAWLKPYRDRSGSVCPTREIETERRELAQKLGIPWPNNALRHSFASYRMAAIQNADTVALEMGNSSQIIIRNSRKVVTKAQASAWFKIRPS